MICIRCHKDMTIDATYCPWCGASQVAKKRNTKSRGNGQGTIYKRGKTWVAKASVGWRWDEEAQKDVLVRRCSGGHKTKKDAEIALVNLMSGVVKSDVAPSLSHYWGVYASQLEALSKSKQTAYRIAWAKIEKLHYKKVDAITVADLRTITEQVAPTYYTRRDIKSLLSHLFELAGADGFAEKDLPDYIQLPSLEEKEREAFSDIEQTALWQSYEAGNKDVRMPLVMIYTGMMPGELMKLTCDMIDFNKKVIHSVGIKTKVRKESAVYFPDCLLPILQELCEESKRGKLFEINKDNLYERYYKSLEVAGVRRLSPYSCRHTTATALAITQNIAPQTIKKIMRWSTTRMLDRYAHATSKDASDAVNTMRSSIGHLLATSNDETVV